METKILFTVVLLYGLFTGCANPDAKTTGRPASDSVQMVPVKTFIDTASSIYNDMEGCGLVNIIVRVTNHSGQPLMLFPYPYPNMPVDSNAQVYIAYADAHNHSGTAYPFVFYVSDREGLCTTVKAHSETHFRINIRHADLFKMKDEMAWKLPGNTERSVKPGSYQELTRFLQESSFYYRPYRQPMQDSCFTSNVIKTDSLLMGKINASDIVYINGALDRSTQKDPLTFFLGLLK